MTTLITPERFHAALEFATYVDTAQKNTELWPAIYKHASVSPEIVARWDALGGKWHLLALSEDWCADAVNTLPVLQRLAEVAPNIVLRILGRDDNPDLMDAHLTGTSRSIPVVMVFDADFREVGWWGPRPSVLQQWFESTGRQMEKADRGRHMRTFYARDKGRSVLVEVAAIAEQALTRDGRREMRDGSQRPLV